MQCSGIVTVKCYMHYAWANWNLNIIQPNISTIKFNLKDKRHIVSSSQDGKVIVWDAYTTNKEVKTLLLWFKVFKNLNLACHNNADNMGDGLCLCSKRFIFLIKLRANIKRISIFTFFIFNYFDYFQKIERKKFGSVRFYIRFISPINFLARLGNISTVLQSYSVSVWNLKKILPKEDFC